MELQENGQICVIECDSKSDGLSHAVYWDSILSLSPSLGSRVLLHPEIYWAWLCARQGARRPVYYFISLGRHSPWQLFHNISLSPALQYVIYPLLLQLMTFLLIPLRKQELAELNFHSFYQIYLHNHTQAAL